MAKAIKTVQVTTNLVETVDLDNVTKVNPMEIYDATAGKKIHEEWQCRKSERIEDGKMVTGIEKQRLLRPRVKITEYQAAVLNEGVLDADNTFFNYYFLAANQDI